MRQAISTKFLGATNTRGARIKAVSASGHALITSYEHAMNSDENHKAAALALAEKLQWVGEWFGGATASGYTFVYAGDCPAFRALKVQA